MQGTGPTLAASLTRIPRVCRESDGRTKRRAACVLRMDPNRLGSRFFSSPIHRDRPKSRQATAFVGTAPRAPRILSLTMRRATSRRVRSGRHQRHGPPQGTGPFGLRTLRPQNHRHGEGVCDEDRAWKCRSGADRFWCHAHTQSSSKRGKTRLSATLASFPGHFVFANLASPADRAPRGRSAESSYLLARARGHKRNAERRSGDGRTTQAAKAQRKDSAAEAPARLEAAHAARSSVCCGSSCDRVSFVR